MSRVARWLLGILITALGAVALVASEQLETSQPWFSSALLEVGAAIFLLLPLLLFERLFELRVEEVERQTTAQVEEVRGEVAAARAEVAAALGRLGEQTGEQLDARLDEDRRAAEDARQDVSFENIRRLLADAGDLRAVSSGGVRVPIQGTEIRVTFQLVEAVEMGSGVRSERIFVAVVGPAGDDHGPRVTWSAGERGPELTVRLIEAWQRNGGYPGAGFLDPDALFEGLINTVEMAVRRRREGETALGPVIELTSERWALTEVGLEHLGTPPYVISRDRFVHEASEAREHMLEKTWVVEHEAEFKRSFRVADEYFNGHEGRRQAAAPPFPLG